MNHISVLIVEDEKNQRTLLKRILTKEGYGVEEAVDGSEAVRKFNLGDFDIVLLDQRLPDTTGIEII